jgi:hypothetical protein
VKSSKRVAEGKIDLGLDAPAKISAIAGLSQYRLELASGNAGDQPTNLAFESGWSGEASPQTPDLPDQSRQGKLYAGRGDAAADSLALCQHRDGRHYLREFERSDHARFERRRHDHRNLGRRQLGSGRLCRGARLSSARQGGQSHAGPRIGLAWFAIDPQAHGLDVRLAPPAKARPGGPLTILLEIKGLGKGEEARVTVAAVDAGILNLTHYEAPDPRGYFFGQRQLSMEIRDLYGLLIDGMQGSRGALRSGGDALGAWRRTADARTARALFGDRQDWPRRVAQVTVPCFLSLGDRSQFHVQIDNVEGKPGDYALDLD